MRPLVMPLALALLGIAPGCDAQTWYPAGGAEPGTGTGTGTGTGDDGVELEQAPPGLDVPAVCQDYLDEPVGEPVPIRISNATGEDLFLVDVDGSNVRLSIFRVHPRAPGEGSVWGCGAGSCEWTMEQGCSDAWCKAIPYYGDQVRVLAGGTYTAWWDGVIREPVPLPPECLPGCEVSCARHRRVRPGEPLTVRLGVSASLTCLGVPCACEPGPEGSCEMEEGDPVKCPDTLEATTVLADGLISVVLE